MRRIKQALGFHLSFQLFKSSIHIPNAVHGHGSTVKLIGAVSWKDGNLAHGNDLHAISRTKPQADGIALEDNTFQCTGFILQCKIVVTGRIQLVVTDLTANRYLSQQRIRIHSAADIFI